MDPESRILSGGAMVVEDSLILALDREDVLRREHPEAEVRDLKGRLVLPGLINSHIHLAQSLFRGMTDDMTIEPWLFQRIWPLQAAHDTETFLAGARLAMLEMMLTGTTTFVESMIIHYGLAELLQEVETSGMRARLARVVMEPREGSLLPARLTESFETGLEEALRVRKLVKDPLRTDIWLGPRWTGMYNPLLLKKTVEAMDSYGLRATMHYAESPEDVDAIRQDTGLSPMQFAQDMGLTDREMLLIHCTYLDPEDPRRMGGQRASLAHCPSSSMKMAFGYADVPLLLETHTPVGLGTDAAACNNGNDLFSEMRITALLHKFRAQDPEVVPARQVLRMATSLGARAIFEPDHLGRLMPGFRADFITVDPAWAAPLPEGSWESALVYSLSGRDVRDVYVDGRQLVREGESLIYDQEKVRSDARRALELLRQRTGL